MSYYRTDLSSAFGGPLTPGVKTLLIANMVGAVLQMVIPGFTEWFWLRPSDVLPWNFQVWRLGTYMFLHGGVGHLLFNMLGLFVFGCSVERQWGTRSFYRYYFLCGLGGAIASFLWPPLWDVPIVGASGAIYGVVLAFGVLFPYVKLLVMLTFPVEARYVVFIFIFVSALMFLSGQQGVAHLAHFGGLATGYALLRWAGLARSGRFGRTGSPRRFDPLGSAREAYRKWRMKRLRKKFEEYYEKRSGGDDPPAIH